MSSEGKMGGAGPLSSPGETSEQNWIRSPGTNVGGDETCWQDTPLTLYRDMYEADMAETRVEKAKKRWKENNNTKHNHKDPKTSEDPSLMEPRKRSEKRRGKF